MDKDYKVLDPASDLAQAWREGMKEARKMMEVCGWQNGEC